MSPSTFLKALAVGTAFWCALYLAFTGAVDPYGVSPLKVSVARINKYKPKRLDIDRLIKPYEVWYRQPRTVFLGTSRIPQAIDPEELLSTRYAPAYNASIPASSICLNASHLRQYLWLDPKLKTVFVELFLYNFLGQEQECLPISLREFIENSRSLFLSSNALLASVQTLVHNLRGRPPTYEIKPGGYFYYPPGHQSGVLFASFPVGIWKLHETRTADFTLYAPAFEALAKLRELAQSSGIELIFLLTPNHAYDDYYIDFIGKWQVVEEWVRRVSAGATVYSFTQPNLWAYETVGPKMRYWNDPYHFSLTMGRAMLAALAGHPPADAPKDFMVRVTPELAAAHVDQRRRAVREWAEKQPEFVARMREEHRRWQATNRTSGR